MLSLVPWLIFLHILSALTFFLAHGTAVAMAFQLRKEHDFARIRAMLDLSASTFMAMVVAFLVMGISGLTLPFIISTSRKHKTRLILNDISRAPQAFNRTTEQECQAAQG